MKRLYPIAVFLLLLGTACIGATTVLAPLFLDDVSQYEYVWAFASPVSVFGPDAYGLLRPVKNALFYAMCQGGIQGPLIGHLIGLGAALWAVCMTLAVANRWFRDRPWGLVCTAVWILAPTMVSAIVWISSANILIMVAALMSALLLVDRAVEHPASGPRMAAAAGFYMLALFSYETAVVFPALLILWDAHRDRPRCIRPALMRYAGFGVIAGLFILLRFRSFTPELHHNLHIAPEVSGWALSAASAFFTVDHLYSWVFPWRGQEILGTYVGTEAASIPFLAVCWAGLAGMAAVGFSLRRKIPEVWFGLLWFGICFLPVSNLVPLRSGPLADYYLVLPSFGLALALTGILRCGWVAARPSTARAWPARAVLLVLIGWRTLAVGLAFDWALAWKEPLRLYQRSLTTRPNAYSARANLARIYMLGGHYDQAMALAQTAAQQAPWYMLPMNVLGDCYMHTGRYPEAVKAFEQAAQIDPGAAYPWFGMAYIYESYLDQPQRAVELYKEVLNRAPNPQVEAAGLNLLRIHGMAGDHEKAARAADAALQYAPNSAELHHAIAAEYQQLGNEEKMNWHWRRSRELRSN